MNIQQLRNFLAVAHYLNFSKAARYLFTTQSALSHSIATLENEVGVKLFYRDTRLVRLTPAGETFLRGIQEIVDKLNKAVEDARRADAGFFGQISIAFLGSLFKRHFSEWIPPFQRRYPNVKLRFEQMPMVALREALEQDVIDVGFTRSFDLAHSAELEWLKIYDERVSLYIRDDHPLASSSVLDFKALEREPFIITAPHISPHWYQKVVQICTNRSFMPDFVYTPFSMDAIGTLVEAGLGIAIVPDSARVFNTHHVKLIPLEGDDAKIDVVAAWKKSNPNPLIFRFVREVSSWYAEQGCAIVPHSNSEHKRAAEAKASWASHARQAPESKAQSPQSLGPRSACTVDFTAHFRQEPDSNVYWQDESTGQEEEQIIAAAGQGKNNVSRHRHGSYTLECDQKASSTVSVLRPDLRQ